MSLFLRLALAGALLWPVAAQAESGVKIGVLNCHLDPSIDFIFVGHEKLRNATSRRSNPDCPLASTSARSPRSALTSASAPEGIWLGRFGPPPMVRSLVRLPAIMVAPAVKRA